MFKNSKLSIATVAAAAYTVDIDLAGGLQLQVVVKPNKSCETNTSVDSSASKTVKSGGDFTSTANKDTNESFQQWYDNIATKICKQIIQKCESMQKVWLESWDQGWNEYDVRRYCFFWFEYQILFPGKLETDFLELPSPLHTLRQSALQEPESHESRQLVLEDPNFIAIMIDKNPKRQYRYPYQCWLALQMINYCDWDNMEVVESLLGADSIRDFLINSLCDWGQGCRSRENYRDNNPEALHGSQRYKFNKPPVAWLFNPVFMDAECLSVALLTKE